MPNRSGSGPPPLLLHGHPQTHVTWHRVGSPSAWYDVLRPWRHWADDVRAFCEALEIEKPIVMGTLPGADAQQERISPAEGSVSNRDPSRTGVRS